MNLAQALPLSEMSVEEKLQAMKSPTWHEEVLRERDRQVEAGEASFMDWEQAKAHVRSRVNNA